VQDRLRIAPLNFCVYFWCFSLLGKLWWFSWVAKWLLLPIVCHVTRTCRNCTRLLDHDRLILIRIADTPFTVECFATRAVHLTLATDQWIGTSSAKFWRSFVTSSNPRWNCQKLKRRTDIAGVAACEEGRFESRCRDVLIVSVSGPCCCSYRRWKRVFVGLVFYVITMFYLPRLLAVMQKIAVSFQNDRVKCQSLRIRKLNASY